MIQRVQTIFLFLIAVGMGITLSTQLWSQGGAAGDSWNLSAFLMDNLDETGKVIQSSSKWYLGALASLAALLALISIFQYKLRSRQLLLNMINSLVMVSLVAATFLTTNGINEAIKYLHQPLQFQRIQQGRIPFKPAANPQLQWLLHQR